MSLIHRPFRRVAIVNRGEAAVRFLRAARAWSKRRREPLEVVALYTLPLAPGSFEAGMVTSLGFGHVGGVVCLVHADRALAALGDEAFAQYRRLRDARERQRLRDELAVYESTRPAVRIRTDKSFAVPADERYAGLDGEQAVLLDAASRRLTRDGPIVAGGVAERIGLPDAPVASPRDF